MFPTGRLRHLGELAGPHLRIAHEGEKMAQVSLSGRSRRHLVVGVSLVGGTAAWAAHCYWKTHAFETAFAHCFSPLALCALVAAFEVVSLELEHRDRRSSASRFEADWRAVCHVLEGDHVHEGNVLKGTWRGRPFSAVADQILFPSVPFPWTYTLWIPAERPGPAWQATLGKLPGPGEEVRWKLRANKRSTEERLVKGGLLLALEEVARLPGGIRRDARLSYEPKVNEVSFHDNTGLVPSAAVLLAHLDLVDRAITLTGMLGSSPADEVAPSTGMPRPYLRPNHAPLWLCGLWFPTAGGLIVMLLAWPAMPWWLAGLLPAACAAPHLWRVRIGRR